LTINFENQEKTNKKPFGKIKGSPKMDTMFYGAQICKRKWKQLQKTWKLRQGHGPITKVLEKLSDKEWEEHR
jgi:hypothetical protein